MQVITRRPTIVSSQKKIFIPGSQFSPDTGASIKVSDTNFLPCLNLPDGSTTDGTVTLTLPDGVKKIKSIDIFFEDLASSGTVRLNISVTQYQVIAGRLHVVTNDSTGQANITPGFTNATDPLRYTIPGTAFDAIGTLTPGNVLGINISRIGADAGDLYSAALEIVGAYIQLQ